MVESSFLDEELFLCAAPSDCGEGWGCVQETAYTPYFCAPDCNPDSCDGACVGEVSEQCIRGCFIGEDQTPGPCPTSDYSCVRTSADGDRGLCYPVQGCRTTEECGSEEVCLSELLEGSGAPVSDNLYCVPAPVQGRCPTGSVPALLDEETDPFCAARCSVGDTRCPPSFACLTQLDRLAPLSPQIDGAVCSIAAYGLSCQDDSNCFYGRCIESGSAQGKICSMTCNEASRLAGGCEGLNKPYSLESLLYTLECDEAAPSADGSGACVARYSINFPGCTEDEGSAYQCASHLECRQIGFGGVRICTRSCTEDSECNEGLGSDPRRWLYQCTPQGDCRFGTQTASAPP